MNTKNTTIIILIITAFFSCEKKINNRKPSLSGEWELASVDGGWVGHRSFPAGNGNTIKFSNDTYTQKFHYDDTSYQKSGSFSVYSGKPCEMADTHQLIKFKGDEWPNILELSITTFSIGPSPMCIMDGATSTYRKISP